MCLAAVRASSGSVERSWRLEPITAARVRGYSCCCQELKGSPLALSSSFITSVYYPHWQNLARSLLAAESGKHSCTVSIEQSLEW